jgi:CheY-like chemotaxis protein
MGENGTRSPGENRPGEILAGNHLICFFLPIVLKEPADRQDGANPSNALSSIPRSEHWGDSRVQGTRTNVAATVLIVDDSMFIVEGLVALLGKYYRTLSATGGDECLRLLETEKPDVIVLDILMEPMDGWETLARIKENPAMQHIPVLLFSAKKITPEEAEANRNWIRDLVIKPVNPRELVLAIDRILESERQSRAVTSAWSRSGIPRETIDEYLALSSNLEVDQSLLAAMKKQIGSNPTPPKNHNDLVLSVAELENRIGSGRDAIRNFFERTGLSLPVASEDPGPVVPEPAVPVSEPVSVVPAAALPTRDEVPGQTPVLMEGLQEDEIFPAPPETTATPLEPVPDEPILPIDAPVAEPVDTVSFSLFEQEPLVQEPAETNPPGTIGPAFITIPSHAGLQPLHALPVADKSPEFVAVHNTRHAEDEVRSSLAVPVHQEKQDSAPAHELPREPGKPAGFFSRIIATVLALFGRGSR